MIQVNTSYNKAHNWFSYRNILFTGYFFKKNVYTYGEKAAEHFINCNNFDDFKQRLIEADGIFSVIIKHGDKVYAASDRSRFFTLFYTQINEQIILTDNFYSLIKHQHVKEFDETAVDEFLSLAITNDRKTLFENIFQS